MAVTYHFGLPGVLIWGIHILVGAFLAYNGRRALNGQLLGQNSSIALIVLGILMAVYHAHIWYTKMTSTAHVYEGLKARGVSE